MESRFARFSFCSLTVYRLPIYTKCVIRSSAGSDTKRLWEEKFVKRFSAIDRIARRKLEQIHAARELRDLSQLPGNRLEKLAGDREGPYSIRVNDQYRICFLWEEPDAIDVGITDYH